MDTDQLTIPGPGPFPPVVVLDACDRAAEYAMAKERAARALAVARLTIGDMNARHALRTELARLNFAHRRITGQTVNHLPEPERSELIKRARAIVRAAQENNQ